MSRVLVVDDELPLVRAVAMNLRARGFDVDTAADAVSAIHLVATRRPDIVLLDLGLPDLDGTSVIGHLRRTAPELPVVVVSARTTSHDKVEALDLGAADYLTKPFDIEELMARVRAALRRSAPAAAAPATTVRLGDVEVDTVAVTATRADGERVHLTPTEWAILATLVRSPGRLVTSRELLTAARGDPEHTDASYLRIYLGQLRRKLEQDPRHPRHLLTEAGMGYRFEP